MENQLNKRGEVPLSQKGMPVVVALINLDFFLCESCSGFHPKSTMYLIKLLLTTTNAKYRTFFLTQNFKISRQIQNFD